MAAADGPTPFADSLCGEESEDYAPAPAPTGKSSEDEIPEASISEPDDELGEEFTAFSLSTQAGGERLDRWLALQMPGRSRSEIQRWIREGLVTRAGKPLKPSYRPEAGDEIAVRVPAPVEYAVEPEPIPLDVIYEDGDVLVINKPAGMVVHPAAGNWHGTLVNAVLFRCPNLEGVGGTRRPGIVHRLDKDTSGVILVAKNDQAHRVLQAQFKEREVHKAYLALVYGQMQTPRGEIAQPIARDPRHRQRMAIVPLALGGRPAVTRYETQASYRHASLLSCRPLTGRTHQIRVHLAFAGHPVVADPIYAGRRKPPVPCPRQFLHAERIRFRLPSDGREVEFSAPLPPDLQGVLDALEAL